MKSTTKLCAAASILACAVLGVQAVPVTFQVNMGFQISQGNFDPSAGIVEVRGSFQSPSAWTGGFTLTNSTAEPTIYRGTYDVSGAAGSSWLYKFVYDNNTGSGAQWEGRSNRSFTLETPSQTLPVVYYNDVLAAAEVDVTFKVDMSVQAAKGNFDPAVDSVEARGSFQSPTAWTGGFTLTNSAANTNIFTGTYRISNVSVGGTVAYKFWSSSKLGWESLNDRTFVLPATATNLPAVFFNNDIGSAVPVTFQIDMTSQILTGKFDPTVDSVEARGSFQSPPAWTGGFTLTNDPAGPNTNLYSNTYLVSQAPGNRVEYKFFATGTLQWENPASTGGGNRAFNLSATPQVLPVATFNDVLPGDILSEDTLVIFNVNMTNASAIAESGNPAFTFSPATDSVYLNGAFLAPPWWNWGPFPPEEYKMTNSPGSQVYSIAILMTKGTPTGINYKYGINGKDNEAALDQNHFRYIRAVGTYVMPLDTFGLQLVEPAVGRISIGAVKNNAVPLSWLGRPGVHLQTTASLGGTWQDVPGTDGLSSTNYPVGPGQRFFRLLNQ